MPYIAVLDVNETINPYAVTTSGESLLEPIHFGGLATRDDLMMSLLDSPPKSGLARLKYPAAVSLVFGMLWLIDVEFADDDETLPSFVWILVAFMLLPGWMHLSRRLTPGRRKQIERINVMAARRKPTRGWIDEEMLVIHDENSAIRASWSFFGPALVFPTHLLLPLTSDASRRVVLPWRFFFSPEDVRLLCQTLQGKSLLMVNVPPNDRQLQGLLDQRQSFVAVDVARARQWSADDWPFDSSREGQFETTIDLAATLTSRRFALYTSLGVIAILIWYFLPLWVAILGWLAQQYATFGDWSFLHLRLVSTLLILIPAGAALAFFVYVIFQSLFASRKIQKRPFRVLLRDAGVHLSHESFESWFTWLATKEVIAEDDCVGWIDEESGDEIRFPKICFAEEATFQEFKTMLQSFAAGAPADVPAG